MGEQISWRVELAVKPGELENFQALTGEMVEATREEPGTLSYERFVTDDGKFVHVYERYADSARGAGALAEVWEDLRRAVREHGGPHTIHRVRQPE
jgi:quinol monooxygenase YgiN